MLTFCVFFDAMEWLFMASWNLYDFWPFLGVKNGVFRRKLPFFQIFGILLLSASASLWKVDIIYRVSFVPSTAVNITHPVIYALQISARVRMVMVQ